MIYDLLAFATSHRQVGERQAADDEVIEASQTSGILSGPKGRVYFTLMMMMMMMMTTRKIDDED